MKINCAFWLFVFITQSVFADLMCDTDIDNYYALYEINSYTCAPGQYLPADALACVSCPSGWDCPGGTFKFNPDIYQGLELKPFSDTVNNLCAINFPTDLFAIYEPNTITINWDDGTNTFQNTCKYDGEITLPPTPTRPGYIFSGWKVKNE